MDKNSLFLDRSIGDFALCVKGKVNALCGRSSFQVGIRLMRGGTSEMGKEELGSYIRGKDDSCSKKGYTSPLNSPPSFKNQAGLSRDSRSNE
jgi:hypothetical protein